MSTLSEPTGTLPSPSSFAKAAADASAAAARPPDHLYLVVVGHVDHGKSTLIGRLLHDTNSLPEGKAERIRAACKAEGMEFEYAFVMDALLEEQAQNITMDTTRVPFRTPRRSFTIIDAPGHKEFLKNMITGAASADAAVLLVDAREGLREQTRRHAFLLSLLGLKQVVVAVNKMDLVNFDPAVFERIRSELGDFLGLLGIAPAHFVPISAKHGDGLLRPSEKMPWHRGPALLEALEQFHSSVPPTAAPLRLTVQDVYRFDARRIVAGLVEGGRVSVGDPIVFHPGNKHSRVKSIETWPAAAPGGPFDKVRGGPIPAGSSIALTLEDEIFVERGQVGAPPEHPPVEANVFTARIFWLHAEPLRVGELTPLRLGTQQAEGRLLGIQRTLDAVTLESSASPAGEVKRHEVAEVRIRVRRPLAFDPGVRLPALGRFVLMRGCRIAGGGVIDSALGDELAAGSPGPAVSRAALLGHQGAVIWMTGLSGAGKSTLAQALETQLLRSGTLAAVLDGDLLRKGLSRNLGFSAEDRRENLRRATELAMHLADAGVVVIAALISPFRAERLAAAERARERGIPFAEVFVNAPLAECERRDPKQLYRQARAGQIPLFTGIDSPYEPPVAPDLELRTDRDAIEKCVEKLTALAMSLAQPPTSDHAGAHIDAGAMFSDLETSGQGEAAGGTVYLVGAGPGDPELLTVKARRLLRSADVVVHDHLIGAGILDHVRPGCERVFVGKKGGHFCHPQGETEALLIARAREGKIVVRLKGGDPSIFARGGEEAAVLAAAGIPFEIVPGVTAALGAAAYAGVPLTHRAHSSAVVFLTGHEDPAKPEAEIRWEDYARLGATLCIYMGLRNLGAITRRLQGGGLKGETPALLVQAATTEEHRSILATVATVDQRAREERFESPAIVIVGEVAAFAESQAWFEPARAAALAT